MHIKFYYFRSSYQAVLFGVPQEVSLLYINSLQSRKMYFLNTHQMTISRIINKQLRFLESISSDVGGTTGIKTQIETNNDCREWTLSKQLDTNFYSTVIQRKNISILT